MWSIFKIAFHNVDGRKIICLISEKKMFTYTITIKPNLVFKAGMDFGGIRFDFKQQKQNFISTQN